MEKVISEWRIVETDDGFRIEFKGDKEAMREWIRHFPRGPMRWARHMRFGPWGTGFWRHGFWYCGEEDEEAEKEHKG